MPSKSASSADPRPLHEVLEGLGPALMRDDRIPKLLAKSAAIGCALILMEQPVQRQAGRTLAYNRLFRKAFPSMISLLRQAQAAFVAETRELSRLGARAYYNKALGEIAALEACRG